MRQRATLVWQNFLKHFLFLLLKSVKQVLSSLYPVTTEILSCQKFELYYLDIHEGFGLKGQDQQCKAIFYRETIDGTVWYESISSHDSEKVGCNLWLQEHKTPNKSISESHTELFQEIDSIEYSPFWPLRRTFVS